MICGRIRPFWAPRVPRVCGWKVCHACPVRGQHISSGTRMYVSRILMQQFWWKESVFFVLLVSPGTYLKFDAVSQFLKDSLWEFASRYDVSVSAASFFCEFVGSFDHFHAQTLSSAMKIYLYFKIHPFLIRSWKYTLLLFRHTPDVRNK